MMGPDQWLFSRPIVAWSLQALCQTILWSSTGMLPRYVTVIVRSLCLRNQSFEQEGGLLGSRAVVADYENRGVDVFAVSHVRI